MRVIGRARLRITDPDRDLRAPPGCLAPQISLDSRLAGMPGSREKVMRLFVRRELMDVETAQGMLAWPHSGFHVHDGVWVAADDSRRLVPMA